MKKDFSSFFVKEREKTIDAPLSDLNVRYRKIRKKECELIAKWLIDIGCFAWFCSLEEKRNEQRI